ncbi:hypothetical protein RUM43_012469 [Polyplax serrata]|uniref:Uncharacterized protein n=1 Tax=Polyplax serrata TaxID=468196 RepID=A0AAN8P4R2_POLSC
MRETKMPLALFPALHNCAKAKAADAHVRDILYEPERKPPFHALELIMAEFDEYRGPLTGPINGPQN